MSRVGTLDGVKRASTRQDRRSGRAARPDPRSHAWTPDQLISAGKPLPGSLQAGFERLLGQDLTDVRIHDDAEAAALAEAAGAAARARPGAGCSRTRSPMSCKTAAARQARMAT